MQRDNFRDCISRCCNWPGFGHCKNCNVKLFDDAGIIVDSGWEAVVTLLVCIIVDSSWEAVTLFADVIVNSGLKVVDVAPKWRFQEMIFKITLIDFL